MKVLFLFTFDKTNLYGPLVRCPYSQLRMKFAYRCLLFLFTVTFFACDSDDSQTPETVDNQNTIADLLIADPVYSDVVVALNRADLLEGLDGSDLYTFYAPTNEALAIYMFDAGFESVFQIPEETLRLLFLDHIVEGSIDSGFGPDYLQTEGRYQSTDYPHLLFFDPSVGGVVNDSISVQSSFDTTNGVLHQVDQVIGFIAMADLIYANPELSVFVEALEIAAVDGPNYRALLDNPFSIENTVFAPSNQAFESALETLGYESLQNIPLLTLRRILNQHIIQDNIVHSVGIEGADPLETLNGEFLNPSGANGILDATGTPSQILQPDVQAANGVVHVVDKVLLPEEVAITINPTITAYAQSQPSLSLFYQALTMTGLDEMFDQTDQEYTVLLPNNFVINFYLDGQDLNDVPVETLEQLILNHTFQGVIGSDDFSLGFSHTMATSTSSGTPLSVYIDPNAENGITFNGMSFLQETDIELSNGTAHMIHRVLAVPNVYTVVEYNPLLSGLRDAIRQDNLPPFEFILSTNNGQSPAPFTFFAPQNPAFDSLLVELGLDDLGDIPAATLTLALNTHVLLGQNLGSGDLISGPLVTAGEELQLNAGAGTLTDPNGRSANIVLTDIQTDNGVIHLIDSVLLGQQ